MAKSKFCFLLFAVFLVSLIVKSECSDRDEEKRILGELFAPNRYDPHIFPDNVNQTSGKAEPVQVAVTLYVIDITKVDESAQQIGIQLYFRQAWRDSRLKYSHINGQMSQLSVGDSARIWKPDTFFTNEVQGHQHSLTKLNEFVTISSDGKVLYSIRLSLLLSCPMNLRRFPHGAIFCPLEIESYGYSMRDIVYEWKKGNSSVAISQSTSSPRFRFTERKQINKVERLSTGNYSRLVAEFTFVGNPHRFVWRLYLPSVALIIASWLSFWLHSKAKIERASLVMVTTLLMVCVLLNGNSNNPNVGYLMLVDQWNIACCIFIFAAFLEFVLVSFSQNSGEYTVNDDKGDTEEGTESGRSKRLLARISGGNNRLDKLSRIVFPLTFIIFVTVYYFKA